MSKPNGLVLLGVIALTAAIMAGLGAAPRALFVSAHEGDTYHLLDILLRIDRGLVQHSDFVTPLGILAFLPFSLVLDAGYGVGNAILLGQVLVAATLAFPIWYAAWSRLTPRTGYVFAAVSMVTLLSLTYGGVEPGLSISMHYNRWAWVVAFILVVIGLVPSKSPAWIDGALIGLGFSALALTKATFFVALLPGIALVLILRRQIKVIGAAAIAGVIVLAATTLTFGFGFWPGYIGDLLVVARSEVRPYPGVTLSELISSPQTLATLVAGFCGYLFLSRSGRKVAALGLALLIPGFLYITYQNFGNDPKWLIPLAAVLLAMRPEELQENETDYGPFLGITAFAAAVLYFPSAFTMAISPLRHLTQAPSNYEAMLPALPDHQDIRVRLDRGNTLTAQVYLDQSIDVWRPYSEIIERPPEPSLAGFSFPHCEILAGTSAWFKEITKDLVAADIPAGSQFFTTDILTAFWLFGPYDPLQEGAPWYYGDLSGVENADYVLVPKCSFVGRVYGIMLSELRASDVALTRVRDTDLYALFAVGQ